MLLLAHHRTIKRNVHEMLKRLVPTLWMTTALYSLFTGRLRLLPSIIAQAGVYFIAAFATRLTIRGRESRYQLACFIAAAIVFEVVRQRAGTKGFSRVFLMAGIAGASLGVAVARPIAHRGWPGLRTVRQTK